MLTAGVISLLCKFLKQPVVLGYIVAGLLAGPYVCGSAWINDIESVDMWGQVGVIFLLFALGLEFSFKKLVQVGSTAFIGCLTIVVGMMTVGFLVGRLMGWNEMNSLFLGGMLCMSSTTIVFKALDDLGLRQQKFAGICFGILVVEDLFAVVLMVLLASIAVKQTFEGMEMLMQVGKLAAYLLFWFLGGIMFIPTFLKYCRKHLNDETMTIVALGLCLGMVLLAIGAGFSSALGAFVMGSILAETVEAERIEHLVAPVKNVFGAVFFVSVGMMINPALLAEYWLPITIITLVVILGQILFASLGVVLSGQSLKVAMQSAFALTQVGEFAFIIAGFGESIGVTEKFLYPVVVAVSVITTFLTPYVIRLSLPAYEWLAPRIPQRWQMWLEQYAAQRNTIEQQSQWSMYLKRIARNVIINLVICVFVETLYFRYLSPYLVGLLAEMLPEEWEWVSRLVSMLVILVLLSPFIFKIVPHRSVDRNRTEARLSTGLPRRQIYFVRAVRYLIAVAVFVSSMSTLFSITQIYIVLVGVVAVLFISKSKVVARHSKNIEENFNTNLNAREAEQDRRRAVGQDFEKKLLSYDLHLADFVLDAASSFCGRQLMELDLRRASGVNVVRIVRGGINITAPGGREVLFPADRIVVAGSDSQIASFQQQLIASVDASAEKGQEGAQCDVTLEQFAVTSQMPFCGKSLAESHIRDHTMCAVLGVEHEGEMTMNPPAATILYEGDYILLAGEAPRIRQFLSEFH